MPRDPGTVGTRQRCRCRCRPKELKSRTRRPSKPRVPIQSCTQRGLVLVRNRYLMEEMLWTKQGMPGKSRGNDRGLCYVMVGVRLVPPRLREGGERGCIVDQVAALSVERTKYTETNPCEKSLRKGARGARGAALVPESRDGTRLCTTRLSHPWTHLATFDIATCRN